MIPFCHVGSDAGMDVLVPFSGTMIYFTDWRPVSHTKIRGNETIYVKGASSDGHAKIFLNIR